MSKIERRTLSSLPNIGDNKYFEKIETYLLDQFPFRNTFRSINAHFLLDVLQLKDYEDVYISDKHLMKIYRKINHSQVKLATRKIKMITDTYLDKNNTYYSIIPDKNFYLLENKDYPKMDYKKLFDMIKKDLKDIKYIDITDDLSKEKYYKTDSHWRQEELFDVVKTLSEKMNFKYTDKENYTVKSYDDFHGVYAGWIGKKVSAEKLNYLTNTEVEEALVYIAEKDKYSKVYDENNLNNVDPYDVFLSGASPIINIQNPNSNGGRLIVFRDSFGSSLTPLLIGSFSEITLVDLRYISTKKLEEYVDFKDAKALFIYNTLIYNQGALLK